MRCLHMHGGGAPCALPPFLRRNPGASEPPHWTTASLLAPPHHGVGAAPLELADVLADEERHVLLSNQIKVVLQRLGHGVRGQNRLAVLHGDAARARHERREARECGWVLAWNDPWI
eukprot:366191-Chlamydomonas_euryale.AAC.8